MRRQPQRCVIKSQRRRWASWTVELAASRPSRSFTATITGHVRPYLAEHIHLYADSAQPGDRPRGRTAGDPAIDFSCSPRSGSVGSRPAAMRSRWTRLGVVAGTASAPGPPKTPDLGGPAVAPDPLDAPPLPGPLDAPSARGPLAALIPWGLAGPPGLVAGGSTHRPARSSVVIIEGSFHSLPISALAPLEAPSMRGSRPCCQG